MRSRQAVDEVLMSRGHSGGLDGFVVDRFLLMTKGAIIELITAAPFINSTCDLGHTCRLVDEVIAGDEANVVARYQSWLEGHAKRKLSSSIHAACAAHRLISVVAPSTRPPQPTLAGLLEWLTGCSKSISAVAQFMNVREDVVITKMQAAVILSESLFGAYEVGLMFEDAF